MKSTKSKPRLAKKISVSFPSDMLSLAELRATGLNRSFSNYLQTLVQEDLANKSKSKLQTA